MGEEDNKCGMDHVSGFGIAECFSVKACKIMSNPAVNPSIALVSALVYICISSEAILL